MGSGTPTLRDLALPAGESLGRGPGAAPTRPVLGHHGSLRAGLPGEEIEQGALPSGGRGLTGWCFVQAQLPDPGVPVYTDYTAPTCAGPRPCSASARDVTGCWPESHPPRAYR